MIIDLTQTLSDKQQVYPGDEPPSLIRQKDYSPDGFTDYKLITGMHVGTHIDGPMHLTPDKKFISSLPLTSFIGKACVIDVKGEKVITWKDKFNKIIKGKDIVLINTGYGRYSGTDRYFKENPVINENFAQALVKLKIKMLGIDLMSVDVPPFPVHKILLSADILIAENLINLDELNALGYFEVIALPLKINSDSSPARIIARKL